MLPIVIASIFGATAAMAAGSEVPCAEQCQVTYNFCIGHPSNENCVMQRDSCVSNCSSTSTIATSTTASSAPASTSSPPAPTTTSHALPCNEECEVTYNFCIGQHSDQNCVMARDSCLKTCSSTSTTSPPPAPTTTSHALPCTEECEVTYNFCIGQHSDQNCVMARDSCLKACSSTSITTVSSAATNQTTTIQTSTRVCSSCPGPVGPSSTQTNPNGPVVTAAADHVKPVLFLAGLGALALL